MLDRWLAAGCALLLTTILGGCVETAGPQATALDVSGAIAHGEMRSPRAAVVALTSLDGAPEPIALRFRQEFSGAAKTREITMADASTARYFLRGYVDAYPTEGGTSVHYVWDLFDASKQRVRRMDDAFEIASAGGDPWAGIDDATLATMAARSADAIAVALSGTPEAVGQSPQAAGQSPAPTASVATVPAQPFVN